MKKVKAILKQRNDDYIITMIDNPAIWDCGKTLKSVIDAFKRTAKSHGFELETLEVNVDTITNITWKWLSKK